MRQGFGKSPEEAKRDEILKRNRELFDRLLLESGHSRGVIERMDHASKKPIESIRKSDDFEISGDGDFSKEFYESYLAGDMGMTWCGPERFDKGAFDAHARKVCEDGE